MIGSRLITALALSGSSTAVLAVASASPPSYWNQVVEAQSAAAVDAPHAFDLHPPSTRPPNVLLAADRKKALARRSSAEYVARAKNDTAESSTANSFDKLQSLSLISNAYNVAINVSNANPPQSIFVQLDTASADTWIVSKTCTDPACTSQNLMLYDELSSPSYAALNLSSSAGSTLNVNSSNPLSIPDSHGNETNLIPSRRKRSRKASVVVNPNMYAVEGSQASAVPFSVQYDSTEQASGVLGSETFTLSGLTVANQIFGLVNSTNITLSEQGVGGVLGLGFARGSAIARNLLDYQSNLTASSQPLMSRILRNTGVSYPLFSLSLTRRGGRLTIGAVDPSILPDPATRGLVEWHDVHPFPSGDSSQNESALINQEGSKLGPYVYWTLPLQGAGVNGSGIDLHPTYSAVGSSPLALIDSGTAGIIGPPQDVQALFNNIQDARHVGDGRFVVPCDTQVRMSFSFGIRNLTLLPEDYIIGPATGNPYLCFSWPLAVPGTSDGIDWIFGAAFLRAQYTLFSNGISSVEAPKIGFYPLRANASFSVASSVLYAPESTASLSAFLQSGAQPVATVLPNSLVPLRTATSSTTSYLFKNATTTPSAGVPAQGQGGASSTHAALISRPTGDVDVPAISNASEPLPLPDNPAETQPHDSGSQVRSPAALLALSLLVSALAGLILL